MPGLLRVISYTPSALMEPAIVWEGRTSNNVNFAEDVMTTYTVPLFVTLNCLQRVW